MGYRLRLPSSSHLAARRCVVGRVVLCLVPNPRACGRRSGPEPLAGFWETAYFHVAPPRVSWSTAAGPFGPPVCPWGPSICLGICVFWGV